MVAGDTPPQAAAAPAADARARPLRWRLLVLALGGLLPLALAGLGALLWEAHSREQEVQRTALDTARLVAGALEADVAATFAVLETLSSSDSLAQQQLQRFEERARAVAEARGWRSLVLADAAGRVLFSTALDGRTPARAVDPESLREALELRRPVVGRVLAGPHGRGPAFAVRLPVGQDGGARWVLSAVVGGEQVLRVVQRQQLPPTHIAAVFDAAGTRIARSRPSPPNAATRPSPSLQALIDRGGDSGQGTTRTLEGRESHTGFVRIPTTGWVVAVGISAAEARQSAWTSMAAVGLGLLASVGLSAWLAWYFAGKVSRPIDQLKAAAAALGRGEPVAPMALAIEELDEVGAALAQASRERGRAAAERREAEAERERLLAQATDALRRAEESARAKDEFLAVLGHELRNPLAPISSALRLMALKGDEATRAERGVVERQLGHMTRLVDDLLDVSRATGGKLAIRREPVAVGPWIEQVVEAVRGSLGRRQLQVRLPEDAAHSWIEGDAVRLAQVLANLLGNAVKFTGEDGTITVTGRRDGDWIEVSVADDGVGLSSAEQAQVFDLFWQAQQSQHGARSGLGLGLSIVRGLVELHGGQVRVDSAGTGRGSRFAVRLPCIAPPAAAATAAPVPARAEAPAAAAARHRVLVVDDNRDAADTAGALLEACGFEVRVAYHPSEALLQLDTFDAEVALLDIGLPGMDGHQLAQAIRQRADGDRIRLVALTGYGQRSDVERAHRSGFDAHMTKPAGADALLDQVRRLADRR